MSYQQFQSQIPEQRSRGRSRNARPPPLPILPPFPDDREEKEKVATKNIRWKEYIASDTDGSPEDESRQDEMSARMQYDEVIRSTIASWKQPKSRLTMASSDHQLIPDIDTTPSDEKPFFDRKRPPARSVSASSNADSSTRDQYQLSRLQARINQRDQYQLNTLPTRMNQRKTAHHIGHEEEKKVNTLKHLRASRIQVVRGLYKSSNQELDENENENESTVADDSDTSTSRDLTTLSSYRGKCFDKMIYLLNDVAPLDEEAAVPCSVNDEGTSVLSSNAGGKASSSVAELKLIKKTVVQPQKQQVNPISDRSVAFPEEIDHPDTHTIHSKFSDVTSPTIQDGFEMDEVPHFPPPVSNNPQRERLPSLAEVNENNSEESRASSAVVGESKSSDRFNLKEASRILESTSSSIQNTVAVDEAIKEASRIVGSTSSSVQNSIVEVDEAKNVEGSPNDVDEVNTLKENEESMNVESTQILCEGKEAELETKAKEELDVTVEKSHEDDIDTKPLPPVKKVTFFEAKEEAVPKSFCCLCF